ncbi:MAG: ribonucleoside triphosphate reductase, partial [Patescibacteria group bacterium]
MPSQNVSQIRKRSGEISEFKQEKIVEAVLKAMKSAGEDNLSLAEEISSKVVSKITKKFHHNTIPAVEEVQDAVEETLIEEKLIKTAKAYILYRDQRRQVREINQSTEEKLMEDYLGRTDWRLKENSNMSFSVQGLNNYIASSISAKYWLNKLYPEAIRKAHVDGDFHIHDLGLLAPYCCGWDLKDLLLKGFGGVSTKIQSKPPKHFRSALGQIVNFFYTMQGEAAGAQAFANFDTYLAPFIRYDDLSYKEIKQALQEFVFNVNVPTRVGFQTPFTNITLDVTPSNLLGKENVIIGGKLMEETYADFQTEMDLFNKAFAEVMIEGDASGRVFAFPIPTYNVDKDFDWNRESLKPMWEMTSKYGIPYFSNFVNSDMNRDDARSMCCRLRLDNRELRKRGGGLFGANPLTGSLGVVTINLARLGYLAKDEKDFKDKLKKLMDLAKDSLVIKRKVIEKFTEDGLYPYSKFYLADINERFGSY